VSSGLILSWSAFVVGGISGEIVLSYESGTVGFERCLGITGRSGSGKSLFARSLACVLPAGLSATSAPALAWQGRSEDTMSIVPTSIVYVPQSPASALPAAISCTSLLEEVIRWSQESFPARTSPESCLKRVGLDPPAVGRLHASQLSGGMAQRFAIALAIARRPSAIVLDEPTVGLDASAARKLLRVVESLLKEGIPVVTVTHDERLSHIADRWLELERTGLTSVFRQSPNKPG
jgi:ABC-type glutathione transport system ATPase component